MDFNRTIDDSMSNFEQLLKKIPGYSGYKEKEQRREADTLLREYLARELEAQWAAMNDLKSQMLTGPAMSQLDDMGRVSRKLQTLIDKVRAAAQGYAGFFDAVKVKEDELDALYDFDEAMLERVAGLSEGVDAVQTALDEGESVAAAVRNLKKLVDSLLEAFRKRRDVIIDSF